MPESMGSVLNNDKYLSNLKGQWSKPTHSVRSFFKSHRSHDAEFLNAFHHGKVKLTGVSVKGGANG